MGIQECFHIYFTIFCHMGNKFTHFWVECQVPELGSQSEEPRPATASAPARTPAYEHPPGSLDALYGRPARAHTRRVGREKYPLLPDSVWVLIPASSLKAIYSLSLTAVPYARSSAALPTTLVVT